MKWKTLESEYISNHIYFTARRDRCQREDGTIIDPYFAEEEIELLDWEFDHHRLQVTVRNQHAQDAFHLELDLPGYYQLKNIRTVLLSVDLLTQMGWTLLPTAVKEALAHVKHLTGLHGRWELISRNPDLVLDVAHNEDGRNYR